MFPSIFMGVEMIVFENSVMEMYLLNTHLSFHINSFYINKRHLGEEMENGIPPWQMQCPNNKQEIKYNYSLHGHILESVESAKYLDCLISSLLRWTKHINSICGKANKILGFLRRNLYIGSTTVKKKCVQPTSKTNSGIRLNCMGSLHTKRYSYSRNGPA